LRYFREEYEQHINERYCPSGACRSLIAYVILEDKCKGCGLCVKVCPQEGISGAQKQPHQIDQVKCIQCGACFEACRLDAIQVVPKAAVAAGQVTVPVGAAAAAKAPGNGNGRKVAGR
jgi:Pyruvate/2-oxoacid:ferredoxin oxidoreductase delta subunit